jgi:hypothetical protein
MSHDWPSGRLGVMGRSRSVTTRLNAVSAQSGSFFQSPCGAARMPRILKRLIEQVQRDTSPTKYFPLANKSERPKSLHDPKATVLPRPTLRPAGYSKSILLEEPSTNIVTRSGAYSRHKSLPPRVNVPHNAQPRRGETDVAREMTEEERRWWTNPYCAS